MTRKRGKNDKSRHTFLVRQKVVDEATGEVVSERDSSFTASMNEAGYRIPSHKEGARMFAEVDFPKELRHWEVGCMARLSKRMIGSTNMIGYREGKVIVAYTPKEMGDYLGMSDRRRQRFLSKMMSLRLLQRVVTSSGPQFYINPMYFMANGQRLSLDLFLLFRDDLMGFLPYWVLVDFMGQAREKTIGTDTAVVTEAERVLDDATRTA